jgi:predicted SAM-dependent methyltransferase
MKKVLEIGCGNKKIFSKSVCTDVRKTPVVDVVCDARDLPFEDNSFDHVYASHIIEHFSHKETQNVLDEWIRVLKENGILEIRCPDVIAPQHECWGF